MVNNGNHPQMPLIQVGAILKFTQIIAHIALYSILPRKFQWFQGSINWTSSDFVDIYKRYLHLNKCCLLNRLSSIIPEVKHHVQKVYQDEYGNPHCLYTVDHVRGQNMMGCSAIAAQDQAGSARSHWLREYRAVSSTPARLREYLKR